MKPLGMDSFFNITRPNSIQDKIWDTVVEAINAGWMPEQFIQETRNCWYEYLREKRENDDKAFKRLNK